jgi:zinc transporter
VFTVVALPINLIAGLFGMNVAGILLAEHPNGFWMVVELILVISDTVLWQLLRQSSD